MSLTARERERLTESVTMNITMSISIRNESTVKWPWSNGVRVTGRFMSKTFWAGRTTVTAPLAQLTGLPLLGLLG